MTKLLRGFLEKIMSILLSPLSDASNPKTKPCSMAFFQSTTVMNQKTLMKSQVINNTYHKGTIVPQDVDEAQAMSWNKNPQFGADHYNQMLLHQFNLYCPGCSWHMVFRTVQVVPATQEEDKAEENRNKVQGWAVSLDLLFTFFTISFIRRSNRK